MHWWLIAPLVLAAFLAAIPVSLRLTRQTTGGRNKGQPLPPPNPPRPRGKHHREAENER